MSGPFSFSAFASRHFQISETESSELYRVMASIFAAVTVEPLTCICFMVFFLDLVTLPQIILDDVCGIKHNQSRCLDMSKGFFKDDYDVVQKESTLWFGAYMVTSTFISLFTLPIIGALSDNFEHTKIMYLTPISLFIQNMVILFILCSGVSYEPWVFILLAPIPAFTGKVSGFYVVAGAYITEITTVEQRTMRFNLLDSAAMLGGCSATLISGLIIKRFGYIGVFVANLGLLLLAILYLMFLLKPAVHYNSKFEQKNKVEEASISEHGEIERQNSCSLDPNNNESTDAEKSSFQEESENDLSSVSVSIIINPAVETGVQRKASASIPDQCDGESHECIFVQENGKEFTRSGEEMGESTTCRPEADAEGLAMKQKIRPKNVVDEEEFNPNKKVGELPSITKVDSENDIGMIPECHENKEIEASSEQIKDLKTGHEENIKFLDVLRHANPFRNFKLLFQCFKASGDVNVAFVLFLLMAFGTLAYTAEMSVLVNYVKNRPFFLDARNIGYLVASDSFIISIVGLGFFSFLMTKVFKLNDYVMVAITFATMMLYYVLLGFAQSLLMLYLIQVLHAACAVVIPTLRSMLTKLVPPSSVGVMMGVLLMIETFAELIGSIMGPFTYAGLAASYPGAVFFVVAGVAFLATIISVGLVCKSRCTKDRHTVCLEGATINNAALT